MLVSELHLAGDAGAANPAPEGHPVSVVGCGNWLQREDRIGPRVLADLVPVLGPDIELVDVGTSVLGLLDHLNRQDLLILIDACIGVAQPGEVIAGELELDGDSPMPGNLHQIGPCETLLIARELYPERFPRRVVLVRVETAGLDASAEARARRAAVAAVTRQIEGWRGGTGVPPEPDRPMARTGASE